MSDYTTHDERYYDEMGEQIDRAMDTKDEQDMLADDEHEPARGYHMSDCAVHNEPAEPAGACNCDDPEADAADAADREADEMFAAYQADTRRTRLVEEVDQSLAYEKNDPKRLTALGWEG